MANLNELENFEVGIYQLETTDPVEAGPEGIDNLQAKQLANRTAWLKAQQEQHVAAVDPHPQYMTEAESNAVIAEAVAALVASSPAALDTLNELATSLGNDPNFAMTITNLIAQKLPLSGGDMTGTLGIKIITETKNAPAIAAGALLLDLSACSLFDVPLNASITDLTILNPPANGKPISFTLIFTADGTARAIAWPASVKWPGGIAPTMTVTNGKKDFLSFITYDAGLTYYGFVSGQNL